MADPMRDETIALDDGRTVLLRPATIDDAVLVLENIQPIIREESYLMLDPLPNDLDKERQWLGAFDGVRSVLFVALSGPAVIGQVDCHAGSFTKTRHVGTIGIAVRNGWREVGLGRRLMDRTLEWMRAHAFEKAELSVFATNVRARRLYESLGFREEGALRKHARIGGAFVDEILMGLWLGH